MNRQHFSSAPSECKNTVCLRRIFQNILQNKQLYPLTPEVAHNAYPWEAGSALSILEMN